MFRCISEEILCRSIFPIGFFFKSYLRKRFRWTPGFWTSHGMWTLSFWKQLKETLSRFNICWTGMPPFLFGFLLERKALKFEGNFWKFPKRQKRSFITSGETNIDWSENWPDYFRMQALIESNRTRLWVFLSLLILALEGMAILTPPPLPTMAKVAMEAPFGLALNLARFPCFATFASGGEGCDPPHVPKISVVELSEKGNG